MTQTIDMNRFSEAGYIKKPHGVKGELIVTLDEGYDEIIEEVDYLFFEVEGLLVPFLIREISFRGDGTILFLFDLINSKEKAAEFAGCKVFIDQKWLKKEPARFNYSLLKGFTVIDSQIGSVGSISDVSSYGGNLVATVRYKNRDVLLPINDDLVVNLDIRNKIITLDCPSGLFNLND